MTRAMTRAEAIRRWAATAALAWAVSAAGAAEAAAAAGASRPNILIILTDTVRYDHLGCDGYARATTPSLDGLAAQGLRCARMISASSWTLPSVMSLMTGVPSGLHGVTSTRQRLPSALTTLAASLADAGYHTGAIVSNPMAYGKFGFSRGFTTYDDYTVALSSDVALGKTRGEEDANQGGATAPLVSRLATSWLTTEGKDGPWLLFLLYVDAHADYTPPPPYDRLFVDPAYHGSEDGRNLYARTAPISAPADRQHLIDLYDGAIRAEDEQIGLVLHALDDKGLRSSTLVLALADHGEEFWDHGGMFHGDTLYPELVHVPCRARWPGHIAPGAVRTAPCSTLDLMPTLLQCAGVAIPPQCMGRPLREIAGAPPASAPAEASPLLISETSVTVPLLRLCGGDGSVIWHRREDTWESFDDAADPKELHPLSAPLPEWATKLQVPARAWTQAAAAAAPPQQADALSPPLDPELVRKLRSLGYLH